jgi:hypothetical protein
MAAGRHGDGKPRRKSIKVAGAARILPRYSGRRASPGHKLETKERKRQNSSKVLYRGFM